MVHQPPQRSAAPVVQELYRLVAAARDAANAAAEEKKRRAAWESEQEVKRLQLQEEMERQIADMRQELSMVKAYLTLHPNMAVELTPEDAAFLDTIPITAHIEPYASPFAGPADSAPMSPVSPAPYHPPARAPLFIEGSSSRPRASQGQYPYTSQSSPDDATQTLQTPTPVPPDGPVYVGQMSSPQSLGMPTPAPTPLTPGPEPSHTRKRPRHVVEDDTDYDSDSEDDADVQDPNRTRKRKMDTTGVA